MPTLTIHAPLSGWCTSLEEVPDPVFAQRMLGDGLAIDPVSGLVIAPCAGHVTVVAQGGMPSRFAPAGLRCAHSRGHRHGAAGRAGL